MTSSKYILIVGILLALLSWGGYVFFLWDLSAQKEEINNLKAEVDFNEKRNIEIREMLKFLESKENQIKDIESYFLVYNEQSIVAFIKKIEEIGEKTGVNLEIFNLSPLNQDDEKYLKASIDIRGEWDKVNKMIALIEHVPYKVSITNLNLKKEFDLWSASLEINILTIK